MLANTLVAASLLVAAVSAQGATTTVSQSMPATATQGFNPAPVNAGNRTEWCRGERNTCIAICDSGNGGGTQMNDCVETSLTYTCVCYNGTAPDVSLYEQSLPAFICQATFDQCMMNAMSDREKEDDCKAARQCGTLDANVLVDDNDNGNDATTTTASTTSPTSSPTASTSPAQTPNLASPVSREMGTGALLAGLMVAFGLFM